jgi:hypothetical protein
MRKGQQYYEPVQAVVEYTEDENSFFLTIYILMGYDMGQPRNKRIKMLLTISLILHALSLVATIVSWKGGCVLFTNACFEAHDRPDAVRSFMYSFYRPTIVGDKSGARTSFIQDLERSYGGTCVDGSPRPPLMKLQASFENKTHPLHDNTFTLTPVATVISFFGMQEANGHCLDASFLYATSTF